MTPRTLIPLLPLPVAGLLAMAVAMGIGRFAFTPLLPIMQADSGMTLSQGGWLASANYLGYLLGALTITRLTWSAETLLRCGLWLVVVTTAAMGLGSHWGGWLSWRFLAGLASAWVFVGTSALCIARLAASGQSERSGVVFSGVGCGIMFAGLACTGLVVLGQSSPQIWLWLALAALLGLLGASMMWRGQAPAPARPAPASKAAATITEAAPPAPPHHRGLHWGLIWCYGVFGFGYILPATFLPAQTRLLMENPLIFGLTWPVFGLAAALSTLISGRIGRRFSHLQIWQGAQIIMALGVFLPVVWNHLAALLLAAVCVGGTLLVITAAGMQQAQITCGPAGAKRQMAAMTASFALGQLVGPLVFSSLHELFDTSLNFALLLGAALLVLGIWPLLRLRRSLEQAT